MRLRKVRNAKDKLENSTYYIGKPEKYIGKWHNAFEKSQPLHLEIGTGKGQFLISKALAHPEINFLGVEKYDSVLVRAIEKVPELNIPNIKFICFDAKEIDTLFKNEITTLYLNFSDPWPKNRHAKRRLTSSYFLEKYHSLFAGDITIIQKTDNIGLFAYSLEEYSKAGFILDKVSLDLHNEADIENYQTEYEEKFSSLGYKINYVEAVKRKR